jgi:hypothetical protein
LSWLRYAAAFVIFCHGFIYIRIGAVLPGPITGWTGTSWLLGSAVTGEPLRMLAVAAHVIAGIATIGCAAALAFAPQSPDWWRTAAFIGAAVGIAAFAIFWDGQTRQVVEEGGIGVAVSLALLTAAVMLPRVP